MEFIEPALFILFLAIISVPLATRFRLPLEVFLVIGSCIVSALPAIPVNINPNVIFKLFLPPILFYAAYFTSWRDFKFNFRVISLLAVGLVIFTTVAVAIVVKLLIPDISWAEGFLLGAIISPTDASAATSIIKKLNAPRRIISILEGESLVNDASALLLFRFSLVAILSGTFSLGGAIVKFVYISIGGSILGICIAIAVIAILRRLRNVEAETTLTFVTAITCFITAELFGVSGVIATVVAGIYFGIHIPEISTARTRINANATWRTLMFVINGFAFTLIGLELPIILNSLHSHDFMTLLFQGIIISVIIIIARMIWVFLIAYGSRLLVPSINVKDPMPRWEVIFLVGWSGMRGIISLAAALSIPYQLSPGVPFPHRDFILLTTYCVIVVTLLLPTLTMPTLLERFGFLNAENKLQEEAKARIKALQAAIDKIEEMAKIESPPAELVDEFRHQFERRLRVINSQLTDTPYSTLNSEYMALKKLTFASIHSEREALINLRKAGEINDETFHHLLDELDFEEERARTLRL